MIFLILFLFPVTAFAQTAQEIDDKISELQTNREALTDQSKDDPSVQMMSRITELHAQIGQIDEKLYEQRRLKAELSKPKPVNDVVVEEAIKP